MALKSIFSFGIIGLLACQAGAFADVCGLLRVEMDLGSETSPESMEAYRAKLTRECELSRKLQELKQKAAEYNTELEQISIYQALRYVDRYSYTKAAGVNTPISMIFQLPGKADSDLVWQNWATGIQQVGPTREQLKQGLQIDLKVIEKIHIGFYLVGNESSSIGDVGTPGEIKTLNLGLISWPIKNQEELNRNRNAIEQINQTYYEMGLQPTPAETKQPESINKILDIRDMQFYPGNPQVNPYHFKNLSKFLNAMLEQARANKHMVWKNRLMTPAELAYFIQQYVVQIHAFADGNGRTSRFWQDTILSLFNLPFGASGDLGNNDMLTNNVDYYNIAMAKSIDQMRDLEHCILDIFPIVAIKGVFKKKKVPLNQINPSELPYTCRLVN